EIIDISAIPFYNGDIAASDRPAVLIELLAKIAAADALVLACPEYNYSLAPALKNVIDWASREADNKVLNGKPVAILGAAGGMGSSRSQYHLRQVCVFVNLLPLAKPEVFANAFAGGFDANGNVTDEAISKNVAAQMVALQAWTKQLQK
ncbi:NADPH-dependent FMN reductase, partial [Iodobacter sp.]|uniref:NADPH-dependent FMN reductase n=1 Tax=Iodobacter sp. TaxID=1915058 RepID=UPI0025EEA650